MGVHGDSLPTTHHCGSLHTQTEINRVDRGRMKYRKIHYQYLVGNSKKTVQSWQKIQWDINLQDHDSKDLCNIWNNSINLNCSMFSNSLPSLGIWEPNCKCLLYTSFLANSMYRMTMSNCCLLMVAPTVVSSRKGSPIFIRFVLSTSWARKGPMMLLCTKTRVPLEHTWKIINLPSPHFFHYLKISNTPCAHNKNQS